MAELISPARSFSDLPVEVQQMIWKLTLAPRIIELVLETYSAQEDTAEAPKHAIPLQDLGSMGVRNVYSAKFSIAKIYTHAALQVNSLSRDFVTGLGYLPWKSTNREGRAGTFYWNPEVDVILFPKWRQRATFAELWCGHWFNLLLSQHSDVVRMAKNLAVYTFSFMFAIIPSQMERMTEVFKSLRQLTLVVDGEVERRGVIRQLEENLDAIKARGMVWDPKINQDEANLVVVKVVERAEFAGDHILRVPRKH